MTAFPIYDAEHKRCSDPGSPPCTRLPGAGGWHWLRSGAVVIKGVLRDKIPEAGFESGVLTDPGLLAFLHALTGTQLVWDGGLTNPPLSYYDQQRLPEGADIGARVWIAGSTVARWEGPVEYVAGSHLLYEHVRHDFPADDVTCLRRAFTRSVSSRGLRRVAVTTAPGDVVVFHPRTLVRRLTPRGGVNTQIDAICAEFVPR